MTRKVLIADDHPLVLHGMRRALECEEDIEIVGEAHSGDEVLALVKERSPDMVLMDIRMPGTDGLECLDVIKRHNPEIKVVLISAFRDASEIREALDRGACAYIAKTVNPVDLASVLRQASDGTVWSAPPMLTDAAAPMPTAVDLTEREITILRAIATGLSNKAISREYWVTEQTVKFHLTNIYRKLGVPNRTAAARYAHQNGLLPGASVDAGSGPGTRLSARTD